MKLYFSPGACSLSPHIVACEAGLPLTLEKVDLAAHKTASGADYFAVNPKGSVPALELDDGQLLTEGPAIVQYLADQVPASGLIPEPGTLARYRVQEWLNFVGTEVHKAYSPLFKADVTDTVRAGNLERLSSRFAYIEGKLTGHAYLTGDTFAVCDAYLFTVLRWSRRMGPDLARFPALAAYMERIAARPAVQQALAAEA